MKSLLRIYRRYIFSAGWIAALVLLVNLTVFGCACIHFRLLSHEKLESGSRGTLSEVTSRLRPDGAGGVELAEEGYVLLEHAGAAFALLLDDGGKVIWEWQAPEEIPDSFTVGEVASFSRWYLKDYPVRVWNCDQGLFVFARQKGSVAKYPMEMEERSIRNLPWMLLVMVLANFLLALLLAVLSGYRMYAALRPVAYGIDALVTGRRRIAPEHGVTGELGKRLNQAFHILDDQRRNLERRDMARTEWISGVSHDIRTPLSMVMGYADNLENDGSLPEETRKEAAIIKEQSLRIKMLIEDLNLTSKLAYHMQPVRAGEYMPAALLRSVAASVLDSGLPEGYGLDMDIGESLERVSLSGDWNLLSRALQNLIGNSIRHNTACHILVGGTVAERGEHPTCHIWVRDDGVGIPGQIIGILAGDPYLPAEEGREGTAEPHIMGLRIVKQITEAHGGEMRISEEGREVDLFLPILEEKGEKEEKETWWEFLWYGKGGKGHRAVFPSGR